MPELYTLGASNITVSDGEQLSGFSQGDGSHLMGHTITLNSDAWSVVDIADTNDSFADNESGQTLNGDIDYDGTSYANGTVMEAENTITVQDPDGNTYTLVSLNFNEPGDGASYSTIEGLAFIGPQGGFPPIGVPLTVVSTSEGPAAGETSYSDYATPAPEARSAESSPACFTRGTLIETPSGLRAIEELTVGDTVVTLDHGPQSIRWIGTVSFTAAQLRAAPHLVPIRLKRGGLSDGLPMRDLVVSPQHRILVSGWRAELHFGESEVLVAAKHLINDKSIARASTSDGVTYIHILFDQHEVVFAEGVSTESFLPGSETCDGFSKEAQDELFALFPALRTNWSGFPSARISLKPHQAQTLSP